MKPASARTRPERAWPAVLSVALLAGFGCSKKITAVDPAHTVPEGTASNASILLVYRNLGNPASFFREKKPFSDSDPSGPSPGDTLVGYALALDGAEGVVRGVVFDSTAASGYQIFTREANGGLRDLFDFRLTPSQRWLDTHWEKYSFEDDRNVSNPAYQARGVVAGVASTSSPLSNPASSPTTSVDDIDNIPVDFPVPANDSVLIVSWAPVPNAVGYFLHVYRPRSDFNRGGSLEFKIAAGAPAPIYDGAVTDAFLAFTQGTSYNLGVPPNRVLANRGIFKTNENLARVTAVDRNGRLIGFSFGDAIVVKLDPNPDRLAYFIYFAGGYVFPRPKPPETGPLTGRLRSTMRSRKIVERAAFRFSRVP